MNTNRKTTEFIRDAAAVLIGCASIAVGLDMFTVPNDIAPGGVSGLATALVHLFGNRIGIGVLSFLLNLPLFLLGWKKFGFLPLAKTLAGTVLLSLFLDLFALFLPVYTNNVLLAAVFAGVLCGFGMALLFLRGASTGGTDLLSMLLNRSFPNISVSKILLAVDGAVVIVAVFVFKEIEVALYSLVTIYITTKVIDTILQGADYEKIIYVVTERGDEINRKLANEMGRGVTVLDARGGYTGREKQLLMIITHRNEFAQTLSVVKSIDRTAFIFVTGATEVHGEGFRTIE